MPGRPRPRRLAPPLLLALALLHAAPMSTAPEARAGGVVLQLPEADRKVLDAKLGAGVVGEALPSLPIADPVAYFPLEARSRRFRVTAGADAGRTIELGVTLGKRPGGTPAWRLQLTPTLTAYLHQATDGDIAMTAMADTSSGVVVVATPPNPFLPKGMTPGETRSSAHAVSVDDLDDPTDQRYAGTLKGTCTYVGTFRLALPGGPQDAILIRHAYTGKVGPADTQDSSYYFFASGQGVVAMISQEDIEAFWIFHVDTTTGKVMAGG